MRVLGPALSVLCLLSLACGGASRSAQLRALDKELEAPSLVDARTALAELFQAAETARDEAHAASRAGDRRAEADAITRARLLIRVVRTESERMHLEAARLRYERAEADAEESAARDRSARLAIEREMERDATRQLAEAELRREMDPATARPHRLPDPELIAKATQARVSRALVLIAAAEALGAARACVETTRALATELPRDPAQRARAADDALSGALGLLGEARALREGPTRDEMSTVLEDLRALGLEPERSDAGTTVRLELLSGRRRTMSTRGRRLLERVAHVIGAHPQSHVQLSAAPDRRGDADAVLLPVRELLIEGGVDIRRIVLASDAQLGPAAVVIILPEFAAGAQVR